MSKAPPSMREGLVGLVASILLAFPSSAIVAVFYRFPVPFAGYQSGVEAIPLVLVAVVFYGLFGGFAFLAIAGLTAGIAANRWYSPNQRQIRAWTLAFAAVAAIVFSVFMATLDKVIGPW